MRGEAVASERESSRPLYARKVPHPQSIVTIGTALRLRPTWTKIHGGVVNGTQSDPGFGQGGFPAGRPTAPEMQKHRVAVIAKKRRNYSFSANSLVSGSFHCVI
jgi:hypothetical protein